MPTFPQLVTGAAGQFPGRRKVARRTVVNQADGGSTVKLADPTSDAMEWTLELAGLTDAEWSAIESLFESVEGRLRTFVFVDPFGNLLRWSEDQSQAAWAKDAGLTVTMGASDPLGGAGAANVANQAGGPASLLQLANAPGGFQYCFSVYARSAEATLITLFATTFGASASQAFSIGPAWRRLEWRLKLPTTNDNLEFGVTLGPGAAIELFGFQVDAQPGASKYRRTTARGGAYAEASFLDDVLTRTAAGVDDNACKLRIRVSG